MNDFFDKLGAAAKRAASNVAADVSVAAEEQKIRDCYQSLGKLCYQDSRSGRIPEGPAYNELYARIEASLRRINELKNRQDVTGGCAEATDIVDAD